MKNKIGYEVLFGHYLKHIKYDKVVFVNKIGYEGQVTVCGSNNRNFRAEKFFAFYTTSIQNLIVKNFEYIRNSG